MSDEELKPRESDAVDAAPSVVARLEAQRVQIFKAMSIIEACRLGSDSMLAPLCGDDEPDFGDALAAAHELLDDVAGELEEAGKLVRPHTAL